MLTTSSTTQHQTSDQPNGLPVTQDVRQQQQQQQHMRVKLQCMESECHLHARQSKEPDQALSVAKAAVQLAAKLQKPELVAVAVQQLSR